MAIPFWQLPHDCKVCEHHHYCMEGRNEYCNCKVCKDMAEEDKQTLLQVIDESDPST